MRDFNLLTVFSFLWENNFFVLFKKHKFAPVDWNPFENHIRIR